MKINEILEALAMSPGRLDKEAILQLHKDNDLLKRVMLAALNPEVSYYIKKIPDFDSDAANVTINLESAMILLDHLSTRQVTGHAGIQHLYQMLTSLPADDADVIVKIIRRNLRCGVSDSTVNKIWPKLIPVFPVMLCDVYSEKNAKHIKYPALAQLKADGLRFNAVVVSGSCTFYSRKGSIIDLLDQDLYDAFIKMAAGDDMVFDGEMLSYKNGKPLPRKEGNGIANKAIKGTISSEESKTLHVVLWDVVSHNEFMIREGTMPYVDRLASLVRLLYASQGSVDDGRLTVILSEEVNSFDEVDAIFQGYLKQGLEGVILKNKHGIWEDARSKNQLKLKAEKTCELKVIGWNYGTVGTVNEKRLGSLLLSSACGKLITNVSGFSDKERDELTLENTMDKIVAVLYNEKIRKKNSDIASLFLPRIIEFCEDRDEADIEANIK